MLTQNDLDEVENLTREIVKEEIKHLPTKDEFFDQTLKILTKLDNLEQAVDIISAKQSEHSDRIETLEKIHPHGTHAISV